MPRQAGPREMLEKAFSLDFLFFTVLESGGSIYFGQRTVTWRKIRVLSEKLVDLPDSRGSVASDQTSSIQVAIHQLIRVLHGKNLVFLSELSQVTFDTVALNRVLITFVDEQV